MPGTRRPPSHTALAALPAIALDLETTGLDVASDRIVQIGTVAMRGPVIADEPRIDTRVDPGVPISAASTRIHGITDPGVAGAPKLAELFESLAEMLAGRGGHRSEHPLRPRRAAPRGGAGRCALA